MELIKLPLASIGLTNALGGGIGAGRYTLCYGTSQAGKSVLFQQSIGQWQKMGLVCAWVDVEGTYSKSWGSRLGIDNDELVYIRSKSAGKIEEELTPHLKAGIDVVVIDSISDIMADAYLDKEGELNPYEKRKQMAQHAKAITTLASGIEYLNERTAVVFLSQVTNNIQQTYVELVPHGGNKMLHIPSTIIRLISSNSDNAQIKGEVVKGNNVVDEAVARKVEYVVKKNKLAKPFGRGEYILYYDGPNVGIDSTGEIVDLGEDYGLIEKKGAWYNYAGQQYQGKQKLVAALNSDPVLFAKLDAEVKAMTTGEIVEQV